LQRGLGLGLAICKHFTVLHGGEIYAASEGLGRGASFTVKLPLLNWYADNRSGSLGPIVTSEP
jgi:signal transduction histidine kinase